MKSRFAKIKGNLIALTIGLVVSLLFAELALQIYNPIPMPVRGQRMVLPRNAKTVIDPPFSSPKFDPQIVVTTNELGLRGPSLPEDHQSLMKIITVGGSTTQCKFTSDDKTWSEQLSKKLRAANDKVWLNNAGLDGNSTFGHLAILDQIVLDLKPRHVMFLIGINDVARAEENTYDGHAQKALRDMIIEKSELLSTIQTFWRSYRARNLGLAHHAPLDLKNTEQIVIDEARIQAAIEDHKTRFTPSFERRVRALLDKTKQAGVVPILITQPALYGDFVDPTLGVEIGTLKAPGGWIQGTPGDEGYSGDNAKARWAILEIYNDVTRKVGAETGTLVIDLARKLPKDSALYFDWMHYSNEGNQKVADIIAEDFLPHLAPK